MGNINISFPSIVSKLHKIAVSNAVKNGNIVLDNTILDENGNMNDLDGGEFGILMVLKNNEDKVESKKLRQECFETLKTYVKYFVGEDESNEIRTEHLSPIYKDEERNKEEQENNKQGEKDQNKEEGEKEESDTLNESFDKLANGICSLLFEASDTTKFQDADLDDQEIDASYDNTEDAVEKSIVIGFRANYTISVQGSTNGSLQDSLKKRGKGGLFGGVIADLKNIKIDIAGTKVNVGHILDKDKWKEAAGVVDIDAESVDNDVHNAFKTEFPNSDIVVKTWKSNELINQLNRIDRLTPDIKGRLDSSEYSITIEVKDRDPNYDHYNRETIAEIASRAFGTTKTILDRNKVNKNDVIKIENVEQGLGLYKKQKSAYDDANNRYDTTSSSRLSRPEKKVSESFINSTLVKYLFESDEESNPDQTRNDVEIEDKYDVYIIPHKRIRSMKEHPNTRQGLDDKGITSIKTSDKDYEPY